MDIPLYPLRFEPIFQYRIWGGRQLSDLLTAQLPGNDPIGEAWILSDRDDHASMVTNGELKGQTISQLLEHYQAGMMGKLAGRFSRFPLLLKFLDAHEMLSVQVHPSDRQTDYIPKGEHGKTEAWVVLEAKPESRIYAGLRSGTTAENLRLSITNGTVTDHLACFTPKTGDAVFIPAGTVHSLGGDIVVFEIQQNSDVTFRLYDWNHVDARTDKPRALQVDQALACINFMQGVKEPVIPVMETTKHVKRERIFECEYFHLWRLQGQLPFQIGDMEVPQILICIAGEGEIEHNRILYQINRGDVVLIPASVGTCTFWPRSPVNLLEIAIP
jgi:mannose-6-phosphate isomerase